MASSSHGDPNNQRPLSEDDLPRIGQWKNFQNPHPELPNPHLSQKPQVSLTRDELRVLQECNRESFWYRSMPACLLCVGVTQLAVNKGYLKPHPKYGGGLKTLGSALLGYIMGKISYQNECRQKIMALPNSQLAETLRQRASKGRIPSEFGSESTNDSGISQSLESQAEETAPNFYSKTDESPSPDIFQQETSLSGKTDDQGQQFKSYGDLRRQNREIYNENQVIKWQNIPNKTTSQPYVSKSTEAENNSQWTPPVRSSKSYAPKNQYGDVWEE